MQTRFGEFVFDPDERVLRKGATPVRLSPKAFQLLQVLIENRPKAVPKRALYDALWPDTFVEEANLKNLVVELRAGLGDDSKNPRFIKTVARFGYSFSGEPPESGFRLVHGRNVIPLTDGEHVIGRSAAVNIPIDSLLISRRHARIVVSNGEAIVEDLGSKNGTIVNGEPITGSRRLNDGDEIALADDVVLFVRTPRHADSTATAPRKPV